MLDLIVLHGEFSLFTVRGNFWYQIYQNQRQKILCQLMALMYHMRNYTLCKFLYDYNKFVYARIDPEREISVYRTFVYCIVI